MTRWVDVGVVSSVAIIEEHVSEKVRALKGSIATEVRL